MIGSRRKYIYLSNAYTNNPLSMCMHKLNKFCSAIPAAIVFLIIIWSYYVIMFVIFQDLLVGAYLKILFIPYHAILILFLLSFWKSTHAEVTTIPKKFCLTANETKYFIELENENDRSAYLNHLINIKQLPVITVGKTYNPQFCDICFLLKPDRTHHCSSCMRCVPKMDHHCPWINNCVGYHNYKYFSLFVFYGFIYCILCLSTALPYFLKYVKVHHANDSDKHTWSLFSAFMVSLLSAVFALALSILLLFHMYLLFKNKSTLEHFRRPNFRDKHSYTRGFDLGWKENFLEVFGDKIMRWPFPVFSSKGDGVSFRIEQSSTHQRYSPILSEV
ncbi:unnamed protein product [Heterobilharzia americana]|nr:unnamed protein product [Heterobilharzia americana]